MYTQDLFRAYRDYRDGLKAAQTAKEAALAKIEKYRGSEGYDADREAVERQHAVTIAALQSKCRPRAQIAINDMRLSARKIKMEPPTDDELRLLTLLEKRENLSRDEAQAAANAMTTTGAADVLREQLTKRRILGIEFPHVFRASISEAQRVIDNLESIVMDTMKLTETGQAAREKWGRNPAFWGDQADPNGRRIDLIRADLNDYKSAEAMLAEAGADTPFYQNALNGIV